MGQKQSLRMRVADHLCSPDPMVSAEEIENTAATYYTAVTVATTSLPVLAALVVAGIGKTLAMCGILMIVSLMIIIYFRFFAMKGARDFHDAFIKKMATGLRRYGSLRAAMIMGLLIAVGVLAMSQLYAIAIEDVSRHNVEAQQIQAFLDW